MSTFGCARLLNSTAGGPLRRRTWKREEKLDRNPITRIARWAKQVLFGIMFLWGTFAAIVAFAVRYEIGVFAVSEHELEYATHTVEPPAFLRPKVNTDNWSEVLGPAAIEALFRAAAYERFGAAIDNARFSHDRLHLALDYRPADSTALWIATYRIGCDCPHVMPDEAPQFEAVIDPLSGDLLRLTGPEETVIPND